MRPLESPYVMPLRSIEELDAVPGVLSSLNKAITRPKVLPARLEADVDILSTCLRLSCTNEATPNSKTHFLTLMLTVVMRAHGERIITCWDAELALPRHPRAHLETLTDWLPKTCRATAVSMIVLDYEEEHSNRAAATTSTSLTTERPPCTESEHSNTTKGTCADDVDVEEDFEAESETCPEGGKHSALDTRPLQLHLFAHASVSTPFCIPMACLAPYETVLDVMASALQQRRAWGLANTPLLGLAFDPRCTRVQTLWGWFEDDASEECCLPLPRVTFSTTPPAMSTQTPSLFGTYDLADRTSALAFTHLLHSVVLDSMNLPSASKTAFRAGTGYEEVPIWRSDTPMTRMDEPSVNDRVNSWLEKLPPPDMDTGSVLSGLPSAPPSSAPPLVGKDERKAASNEKGYIARPSAQSSSSMISPSARHPDVPCDNVYFWGLSRTVLVRSFNGALYNTEVATETVTPPWHDALVEYQDMVQPQYNLSESIKRYRRIWGQGDEGYVGGFLQNEHAQDKAADERSDELEECLLALIPAIFLVVELAQEYHATTLVLGHSIVPEASWRILWDFLSAAVLVQLQLLRAADDPVVDVLDILEETMRLPHADGYIEKRAKTLRYINNISNMLARESEVIDDANAASAAQDFCDDIAAQRLATLQKQAEYAAFYHLQAAGRWVTEWHRPKLDHRKAPLRTKADGPLALALNDFFDDADLRSYRARPESELFLPLEISHQSFKPLSHAAQPATGSDIYRPEGQMDAKTLADLDKPHSLDDTLAAGIVNEGSSVAAGSSGRQSRCEARLDTLRARTDQATSAADLPNAPQSSNLLVPFCVRESKRPLCHPEDSGVHQSRMGLTACTKFLGVLGVSQGPTYGIITEGPLGSVHMSVGVPQTGNETFSLTKEPDELAVHVFERGATVFDLQQEESAFAYVAFLVRLHTEVARALAEKLKNAREHVRALYLKEDDRLSWSMLQHPAVVAHEKAKAEKIAKAGASSQAPGGKAP
ncbi:unnamed protein product [Peniophora sp. CBMAI 1063]|nr:unnamed protein product [Peniophora sp. CBMAI 1063]